MSRQKRFSLEGFPSFAHIFCPTSPPVISRENATTNNMSSGRGLCIDAGRPGGPDCTLVLSGDRCGSVVETFPTCDIYSACDPAKRTMLTTLALARTPQRYSDRTLSPCSSPPRQHPLSNRTRKPVTAQTQTEPWAPGVARSVIADPDLADRMSLYVSCMSLC